MTLAIPTALSLPHTWRAARTADRVLLVVLYAILACCLVGDVYGDIESATAAPEVLYVNPCAFPVEIRVADSSDFVLPPNRARFDPEPGPNGLTWTDATVLRDGVVIEKIAAGIDEFRDPKSPDVYRVYVSDVGGRTVTGSLHPQDESDFDALAREYGYGVICGFFVYLLWMRGYVMCRPAGSKNRIRLSRAKLAALPPVDRRRYAAVTGLTLVAAGTTAVAFPVLDADETSMAVRIWIGIFAAALWYVLNVQWACLRRSAALLAKLP